MKHKITPVENWLKAGVATNLNSRKSIPGRFFAALTGLLVVNLVIAAGITGSSSALTPETFQANNLNSPMYGTWTWWMARAFVLEPRQPDIVLLGSSQMNSPAWAADATFLQKPVDCLLHRQVVSLASELSGKQGAPAHLYVANCAMQGGMASDYYMIERTLLQGAHKPKLVVVGISPRDFVDNNLPCASATEPFRFFERFVDAGKLSSLAYPDLTSRLFATIEWRVNALPLRRLHEIMAAGWERHCPGTKSDTNGPAKENSNQLLAAISNSHKQVNVGEWVVSPNMKPVFVDNSKEYISRYKNPNPKSLAVEYAFFQEFLQRLNQANIPTIIVGMPTTDANRALLPAAFWQQYRRTISAMCASTKAQWVDLSQSKDFQQADYVDTVHLNDRGGLKFFHQLADTIARNSTALAALQSRRVLSNSGTTR